MPSLSKTFNDFTATHSPFHNKMVIQDDPFLNTSFVSKQRLVDISNKSGSLGIFGIKSPQQKKIKDLEPMVQNLGFNTAYVHSEINPNPIAVKKHLQSKIRQVELGYQGKMLQNGKSHDSKLMNNKRNSEIQNFQQ